MTLDINFKPYSHADKNGCLELFDANCPKFFAPNERAGYFNFLDTDPVGYELCSTGDRIAGAFGLIGKDLRHKYLNWMLIHPQSQGLGIGSEIMRRVTSFARADGVSMIHIAASHKSKPFFAKFGAIPVTMTANGWGPEMHRIDMELRM